MPVMRAPCRKPSMADSYTTDFFMIELLKRDVQMVRMHTGVLLNFHCQSCHTVLPFWYYFHSDPAERVQNAGKVPRRVRKEFV